MCWLFCPLESQLKDEMVKRDRGNKNRDAQHHQQQQQPAIQPDTQSLHMNTNVAESSFLFQPVLVPFVVVVVVTPVVVVFCAAWFALFMPRNRDAMPHISKYHMAKKKINGATTTK